MKRVLKAGLALGLGLLLLALVVGLTQRERLTRLMAVNTLFAPEKIVGNFVAMDSLFEHVAMPLPETEVTPLATGPGMTPPPGFDDWLRARSVTGIVVLKGGTIRHEAYPLTAAGEADPARSTRISWSVAKSYLATLIGVLHEDGTLPDLEAPVTDFAPDLKGSAYDGASIRDVMQMSSGVVFDEDYLDFWSDINKMGRVLALGGSMDGFAADLSETFATPGSDWQYVSIDTHVLGMVIRGATGRSVPDLLNQKVLSPLGSLTTPYYLTDGYGVAFVLGGLNLTTRDYARFGQMIADGGVAGDTRIVSEAWITESTRASAPTDPGAIGYGYQWWVPMGATEGQFMARGVYGQYIYIDRPRGVVIVVNGADRQFREPGVNDQNVAMFRMIAEALDG